MQLLDRFKALGTLWWIEIFEDVSDPSIKESVVKVIVDFEKKYSRFSDNSIVSTLNRKGVVEEPPEEFIELIQTGISLYEKSDGQFNFLLGITLEDRGYDKDLTFEVKEKNTRIPLIDSVEIYKKSINLDLSSGAKIDFGGFGKAYLIRKISKLLIENDLKYHLINGGGDIFATSDNNKPIEVLIRNPINRNLAIGRIAIKDEAFCGSSILERSWKGKGSEKVFSHIIDPGNSKKLPAGTVYLLHTDVIEADAFATTLTFKFDDEKYLSELEDRGFKYMIIAKSGLIRSGNFPVLK